MPEQTDGAETDDLDAVFRGLVHDVEAHTSRPGVDRAVRTAGGRRTALTAAALVAVLVVAGSLGAWALRAVQRVGVPAAGGPSTSATAPAASSDPGADTPVAAPMTVDGLNAATAGWTTWEEGAAGGADVPECLRRDLPVPDPVDSTIQHFHAGDQTDAFLERTRYASRTDSNRAMLARVQELDPCPQTAGSYYTDFSADLEVVAFPWGHGARSGAVWLVNFGDRMDVFNVVGAPQPRDDVFREVSRLVAEDVQVP